MRCGHGLDVAHLDVGGVQDGIDTRNARDEIEPPADVEGGAGGRRHGHAVDVLDLACREARRCERRASAASADLCGSTRQAGPVRSTSCPTSRRLTDPRRLRGDATTTTPLLPVELRRVPRLAECARPDRPACRTGAAAGRSTLRLRRLPILGAAIPVHPPWAGACCRPPTQLCRLCRFVHRFGVSRTRTAQSGG